ncbi:MAG: bifunctional metallophosphatase/5'-nucleotidase [Opitutaceae bacterium]|nr:bifunctional metallophosphatase/5'-nucleotidase [Opitutaceae bacterium]
MVTRFNRRAWGAFLAFVVLSSFWGVAAERVQVTVLATTDMHGNLMPVDYFTNRPADRGLARVATLIADARKSAPEAILIDCGDTIQGSPMAYYFARKNSRPANPMMVAMNALRYDAMTIGNHEFNFGLSVLEKARREAQFPWLSANTYQTHSNDTGLYTPYIIKEVSGVRVAILGITTAAIPNWEEPANYAGHEFRETISEAKKWVAHLRTQEKADLVVAAVHMGLEEDLRTGSGGAWNIPGENTSIAIAEQVSGIDVMFMGHTHREVSGLVINGVLMVQAGRWADMLARADVYLDPVDGGGWTIAARSGRTIPVTPQTATDPAIAKLIEPYETETQAWLGKPIGTCAADLTATDSRLKDTAILDLIQRVQLEAGGADVSFAASFNLNARLPKGAVTVRDIAGLYVYENSLVVVEVTGAQIKAGLEHAARYFLPYSEGKTAAELIDTKQPGYNFDLAEGVDYTIDLTRPVGDRIVDLKFRGEPLAPDRKLKLALNNYRVNGGGGYAMFKGAPVVWRSGTEIRDLIIDWVEKHGSVPAEPTNNWRILPAP